MLFLTWKVIFKSAVLDRLSNYRTRLHVQCLYSILECLCYTMRLESDDMIDVAIGLRCLLFALFPRHVSLS